MKFYFLKKPQLTFGTKFDITFCSYDADVAVF